MEFVHNVHESERNMYISFATATSETVVMENTIRAGEDYRYERNSLKADEDSKSNDANIEEAEDTQGVTEDMTISFEGYKMASSSSNVGGSERKKLNCFIDVLSDVKGYLFRRLQGYLGNTHIDVNKLLNVLIEFHSQKEMKFIEN
jgi:hypothetical protein